MSGFVSLVGAGPGDPDLLTLKAARRLAEADLVLYDGLVPAELLRLAPTARRFYVGKRSGRAGIEQETINKLMILEARKGRQIVRLKCGDPFVLGRGGEEALALSEAGVDFEVIPGISSALSAPALAGIPVTHRGLASAFLVVSGHAEGAYRPILESLAPGSATLVVLMGLANRTGVATVLLDRGWSPSVPAAILLGASTEASWTWTGSLADLGAAKTPERLSDLPGCLCVGEVVSVASKIFKSVVRDRPVQRSNRAGN